MTDIGKRSERAIEDASRLRKQHSEIRCASREIADELRGAAWTNAFALSQTMERIAETAALVLSYSTARSICTDREFEDPGSNESLL